MLGTILSIISSGLSIYKDKIKKEWANEYAEHLRTKMEIEAMTPIDRDMRKYDEALKGIHLMHERLSIVMKQEAQ